MKKLNEKEKDANNMSLNITDIDQRTARFLANLLGDVMSKAEKHKLL